jgi:hypothetical protein
VRPLRAFGSPVLDLCEPKPDVAHQTMFDASFPHGWRYYFRACDVSELTDDVIDVTIDSLAVVGNNADPEDRAAQRQERDRVRLSPIRSVASWWRALSWNIPEVVFAYWILISNPAGAPLA